MGRAPWWLPWSVYGPLGALGAGLCWTQRKQVIAAPAGPRLASDPSMALGLGLALALLLVVLTVRSTRWLVEHTAWAHELASTLRGALLGASGPRLLTLALLSALSEELFFRGALLPYLGLFASSLIFGALHISSRDAFLPWMLWAALMGALFGLLFVASGSLLPPIVAHAAINYTNMRYLCNEPPSPLARLPSIRSRARGRASTSSRALAKGSHEERWRRL